MATKLRVWIGLGVSTGTLAIGAVALVPVSATAAADAVRTPTFTKDVAPIFKEKCEACHRPNNMAPMSLITYEQVRPWARAVALRVESRQMPPWHIDKTIGIQHFKNDRSLSDEQVDTIVRWVAAGAPQGDPKDMPPARVWPDESKWQLAGKYGAPDLVITSAPYTMPAAAQDAWWQVVHRGHAHPHAGSRRRRDHRDGSQAQPASDFRSARRRARIGRRGGGGRRLGRSDPFGG